MTESISKYARKYEERWHLRIINGELVIDRRSISQYVPIDRLLDEVDYYDMERISINGSRYTYTCHKKEAGQKKSEIMVLGLQGYYIRSMNDDDLVNMPELANKVLKNDVIEEL